MTGAEVGALGARRRRFGDEAVAAGFAGWLRLAATPTFVAMALLTALGASPVARFCGAGAPFAGMLPMYLLMAAFHAPPWLQLLASRRGG